MTQKTVGYVELEWTCKRCGTKNPGTLKACANCGAAMSDQDKFEAPAQQELIQDKEKLAQAARGPDIHCPYCGTRNAAGTEICTQCGGNLKDAQARQQGQVMGAFQAGPAAQVRCPACGTLNPANAARCTNCGSALAPGAVAPPPALAAAPAPKAGSKAALAIILGVIAVVACAGLLFAFSLAGRTKDISAVVQSVRWQRSIQVMEIRPVERTGWEDQAPAEAEIGQCTQKLRSTQNEPAPGAEEVCGTPYSVDQGNGIAKVVQDCQYKVYDQWCTYSMDEWTVVDTWTAQGSDLNPSWPEQGLLSGQKEGDRSEDYEVLFQGNGQTYTYSIPDAGEFSQYSPGSQWTLKVNGFGAVTEALPR